ncbi:single-stranded DNA-binding protein [Spiroplasma endosymbiont of Anurida maritima]|uniref:single-stranded DNA-binding protein n=1 Tax=Spiroplasma endosymbiont of Anurida maritima TaxID=2967972 RepID=UPI0036D3E4A7
MNSIIFCGVIVGDHKVVYSNKDKNNKLIEFKVSVKRPFKSKEGIFEYDVLCVKVWIALIDLDEIFDGNIVAVRGRLQSYSKSENDRIIYEIIAERVNSLE